MSSLSIVQNLQAKTAQRSRSLRFIFVLALMMFLVAGLKEVVLAATYHGRVVDVETGEPLQGAVFQIIHNGTSSKDLRLAGTIKGVEAIKRREVQFYTSRVDFILQNLHVFYGLVGFATLAVISVWEYLHEKGGLTTSMVTSKPANEGHLKTGQRRASETGLF